MARERIDRMGKALDWLRSGHECVTFSDHASPGRYVRFQWQGTSATLFAEVASGQLESDAATRPCDDPQVVQFLTELGFTIPVPELAEPSNFVRADVRGWSCDLAILADRILVQALKVAPDFDLEIAYTNVANAAVTGVSIEGRPEEREMKVVDEEGAGGTSLKPWQAVLPPGHNCRTDDLAYESVGEWYEAHRGRVPIQTAAGLTKYMREHKCSFAEAFEALSRPGGPMILIETEAD
jgi:hypothetical protein